MKTKKHHSYNNDIEEGPDDLRPLLEILRCCECMTPVRRPLEWWGVHPFELCELQEEGFAEVSRSKCRDGVMFCIVPTEEGDRILAALYGDERRKWYANHTITESMT